jgi:hypothetical protein
MTSCLFKPHSEWPVIGTYDVAVMGAGPSGIGAAVSAARMGMKTIIIEKYGSPGGVATLSNVPYYMGFGADGQQMIAGLAEELIRDLDAIGAASVVNDAVPIPEYKPVGGRTLTGHVLSTSENIRLVINRKLEQAGVTRLYYASLIGTVVEDGYVTAAAVDCAEGPGLIKAKAFVDGTGDAQLVYRAGGQVREYSVEDSMHKSIFFDIGGVTLYDVQENKKLYKELFAQGKTPPGLLDYFACLNKLESGMVKMCLTKAVGSALSSSEMTRMDIEMRAQIPEIVDFLRREMPGFSQCYVVHSGIHIGVRAGRGIVGIETLTRRDIDEQIPVKEPVAVISRTYGSHSVKKDFIPQWRKVQTGFHAIPWRALMPVGFKNVLAGGRAISVEPHVLDVLRLAPRCMTIGQAAGVTAALSAMQGIEVPQIRYEQVRKHLLDLNVILDMPVPAAK